jgi:hypothetical protein
MADIGAITLIGIGGGLSAIGVGLGIIAAATLGSSVSSALSSAVGAVESVLNFFTGETPAKSPEEIIFALVNRVDAIQHTSEAVKIISQELLSLSQLPSIAVFDSLFNAIEKFGVSEKPKNNTLQLFISGIEGVNEQLETLAQYQTPMENLSLSFQTIATSMGTFKDNINMLEIEKLTGVGNILYNVNQLANRESIIDKVTDFAKNVTENAFELFDKFGFGETEKEEPAALDKNETDPNLMQTLRALNVNMLNVRRTMASIQLTLQGELDVRVTNEKIGLD